MKKALCFLLIAACLLAACPCDGAQAADMQPPGTTVSCCGIRLKPELFTLDRKLILKETKKTFADDLSLFMLRFQVVKGYITEDTLKELAKNLRLYYIATRVHGTPWDVVSFGKKISTFDLIFASREISSLKEAALYAFDGTSAIYSLSGLPKTGKALSASEKAKGPLVTLRPTMTHKPAFTSTPKPTRAPRQPVTPSPDAQAELTRKMQEIRDSVSPGETMPTLRGKLFIAVFDEKDKLFLTSSSYDWTHASLLATYIHGIPEERLARGIEDADTMILVYRKLSEVGTYEYGIYNEDKGYAAYTMVAAIYRGKVQTFSSHVSWPPNVKHTKGSAYGTYEYKTALNDIRNAKWESLGPGGK